MTDVVVEFKVPGDYVVQQSPQNLPPVYSGEKMVVYGVLTHKGSPKDQTITGKAILKGQILGKKMEHSVPFVFNPVSTSSPSLPTIHHLAAKSLIKDWQDQGKSKEEIVKLSIESSVISSHTAFIVVDEENSEPVTGAMKTWDVQAAREYDGHHLQHLQQQVASVQMSMSSNIDRMIVRGDRLDDLSDKAECLSASSMAFSKTAKKKGGFSFGSLFSGFTSLLYGGGGGNKTESSQPALNSVSNTSSTFAACEISSREMYSESISDSDDNKEFDVDDLEEELHEELERSDKKNLEVVRMMKSVAPPKSPSAPSPHSAMAPVPSDTLTAVITAQQADGSWKLDTTLAELLTKSQKVIEDSCPTECKDIVAAVWATVLILTLLRKKYSSQQDEWELIAMKAESWLKKQTLPSGVTIQDLYSAAEVLV